MSTGDTPEIRRTLEGVLRWYADMGVDAAVDEIPHDRFAAPKPTQASALKIGPAAAPAPARESPPPAAAAPPRTIDATPVSAETLVAQAKALAASASDLDDLRAKWESVPGCNLAVTAGQMIFEGGTRGGDLMLIGAAPEADDERQGAAHAGQQGRLVDNMLRAIKLDRARVYFANVVPWRPPGGRPPSPLELALCLPFARRQIALAAPSFILCLGERAAQPLLDTRDPIGRLRGRWLRYEGDMTTTKTLVTFSPDYLLKQPLQKRRAWADLQMFEAEIAMASP